MRPLGTALLLACMLAGCSDGGGPQGPSTPNEVTVEGYVVGAALEPLAAVPVVVVGHPANTTTGEDGHFVLQAPSAVDLVLLVQAPGHVAQSRAVAAFAGEHVWLNLSLEAIPFADPYHVTDRFTATIPCAVTATVGEDPSKPHEHQGVRCNDVAPSPSSVWNYTIPANTTGLILEAFWDPSTPLSTAIVLRGTVPGSGDVLAFTEGRSPIKQQLSRVALQQNLAAGHDVLAIEVRPGAGTGQHDHGSAGAFVNQQVQLFLTAFFNGPVDPTFTVADAS